MEDALGRRGDHDLASTFPGERTTLDRATEANAHGGMATWAWGSVETGGMMEQGDNQPSAADLEKILREKVIDEIWQSALVVCGGDAEKAESLILLVVHPDSPFRASPKEIAKDALKLLRGNLEWANRVLGEEKSG
jgi:hypothetical protein